MTYLLSPEEIREKSAEQLNVILREQFDFDAFAWQQEKGIRITERFRADGLERVLYKCPECHGEGCMTGKGTRLICSECGKEYELTEEGSLRAIEGITEFSHKTACHNHIFSGETDYFQIQRRQFFH